MYTNAVAHATDGHDVLLEFEAFRASCAGRSRKADSLYANAVAQAAAGHDVLRECEAPRVVRRLTDGLLTNAEAPGHKVDCRGASTVALSSTPNTFADAVLHATAGRDVFRNTGTLYLAHSQELVSLQGDAVEEDKCVVKVDTAGQVPGILARAAIERSCLAHLLPSFDLALLSSGDVVKLAAGVRTGNIQTGRPPTQRTKRSGILSIHAAKGTARSAVTGPRTPEIVLDRGRSPSTDSVYSPDHLQSANSSPGQLLRISGPCSFEGPPTCAVPNVTTKTKKRKRKFKPKVRSDKPKGRRAKRSRIAVAGEGNENRAASPPVLIFETRSLSLRRMKELARLKHPRLRKRVHIAIPVSKEAQGTGEGGAPRLDTSAEQTPDGHDCGRLRCSGPSLPGSVEAQVPLADEWSSNLEPLVSGNHGRSLDSDSLIEAFCALPGIEMSRDELRNVLQSPPECLDGPPVLHPAHACQWEKSLALAEDLPSTPRGPAFVSVCQDFVMSLSSPPSPCCDSDWDAGFSCISATSTRRYLNFDAQTKKNGKKESEVVDVDVRNEPASLLEAASGISESGVGTGLELLLPTDQESPVSVLSLMQPLPLDTNTTIADEQQIVVYDGDAKRIVPFRKLLVTKGPKPRVELDVSTKEEFKRITSGDDDTERERESWKQSREQWQNRVLRFISIMRQVQGNRSFSRWKGSVVDSVGGAFLTQNVSDFLSSNAFMELRAQFPARHGTAKEGTGKNSTPFTEDELPIVKESACILLPERSATVEEDDRRQKLAPENQAALLSKNVNENVCTKEALVDIVETQRKRPRECHIEHGDHDTMQGNEVRSITALLFQKSNELRESLDTQQRFLQRRLGTQCTTAGEACASESHALATKPLASTDVVASLSIESPLPRKIALSVVEDRDCSSMEEAETASSLVPPDAIAEVEVLETGNNLAASSWTGQLAIIHEKFENGVPEESVCNLTVLGKEKVLAATLSLVLGKKPTTEDRVEGARGKAVKGFKLRPLRARERRRTDNFRYRQGNAAFTTLAGADRAEWEANFSMKSQKYKWEPLRHVILLDESFSRDPWTEDCVDWEAVRLASVHDVAKVIKNRGMHNALAGRIKAFLDRVYRDQDGSIDLEWIRKLAPEDAKEFLLSFRGVGLKSVECIRLLTLHHPSFPVDTNVGRIAVRLGWVPLQPLPEETQLHLLDLYPIQAHIQQYIWPRICKLDQQTLYELHYQMITFGKVFCTKSKPNCNACPMRSECKHYASSYASARLLLKWPEEVNRSTVIALPGLHPVSEVESTQQSTIIEDPCMPIIEEPGSPEPSIDCSTPDIIISDIEEFPFHLVYDTSVETQMGCSKLIIEEVRSILDMRQSSFDYNHGRIIFEPIPKANVPLVELEDDEAVVEPSMRKMPTSENTVVALENAELLIDEIMELSSNAVVIDLDNAHIAIGENLVATDEFKHLPSQELMLIPPESAPAPKLKNVQRLRTVHFVYELPDNHPLLFEMDQREATDPCFYLLAIWSPDEVPATMPTIKDEDARNPFASCENNDAEQIVRGTLLIPCKTAMRGSFPLNGTYFQVNEVFADHASSIQPIDVPRTLLWSLRRRFVYFSTAVSNLFRDMSQEEIQCCFKKGYVCLRAFDLATRQPKLLAHRLHQSGAKIVRAPVSGNGRGRGRPRKQNTTTTKLSTTDVAQPSEIATAVTEIDLFV